MSQNSFLPVLMQLAGQAPVLLVYVVGIILALVFWGRYRMPSMLTLIACVVMLVASIAQTVLWHTLLQMRESMGWSMQKYGSMMSAVSLVSSVVRAIALGTLLGAVFAARRPPAGQV